MAIFWRPEDYKAILRANGGNDSIITLRASPICRLPQRGLLTRVPGARHRDNFREFAGTVDVIVALRLWVRCGPVNVYRIRAAGCGAGQRDVLSPGQYRTQLRADSQRVLELGSSQHSRRGNPNHR